MKTAIIFSALCLTAVAWADFFQNVSAPANGKVYVATPTALKINPVNASAKTFVVVNDDPENPVLYGDSACGPSTGQKIQPGEKVTFVGIPSPFNLYVCTATGSATVRVVEQ